VWLFVVLFLSCVVRCCSCCVFVCVTFITIGPTWPSQIIRSLRDCCAQINNPFTPPVHLHCPPWGNAIARLLRSSRLPYTLHHTLLVITRSYKGQGDYGKYTTPPPTALFYAMYHTLLVLTISCKGQGDYSEVYDSPTDRPFACYAAYTIGNNKIV